MNEYYQPILVDASADDILAVLRDNHRQQCTSDPVANPRILLSHDSTIAEWRDACDLLPWDEVAQELNSHWKVIVALETWREILEPAKERRLRGVCELLARYAKLPRVRPVNLLGQSCASAGAFLTIRSFLAEAGVDVSDVAPSTLLHEYTRCNTGVFLGSISQLAPETLPLVKIDTPAYHAFMKGMLLGWVGMFIGLCSALGITGGWAIVTLSFLLFVVCYVGVEYSGQRMLPASVQFGELKTFGDLSKVIANATYV